MPNVPRLENYETPSDGPTSTPTLKPLVTVAKAMVDSLNRGIDHEFGLGPLGSLPGDEEKATQELETSDRLKAQMRDMSPEPKKPRI